MVSAGNIHPMRPNEKMSGKASANKERLGVYLPKQFMANMREHSKRLGVSFTYYILMSGFRSLFEGLHENPGKWSGDVLLTKEVRDKIEVICQDIGMKHGTIVNYLLRKDLEKLDKRENLDHLIDEIMRKGGLEDA